MELSAGKNWPSRQEKLKYFICYNFSWAFIVFIILNMFTIIVVLSTILIGQISYQYSAAQTEASIQNDIDRAKLITGLDRSIFTCVSKILLISLTAGSIFELFCSPL